MKLAQFFNSMVLDFEMSNVEFSEIHGDNRKFLYHIEWDEGHAEGHTIIWEIMPDRELAVIFDSPNGDSWDAETFEADFNYHNENGEFEPSKYFLQAARYMLGN